MEKDSIENQEIIELLEDKIENVSFKNIKEDIARFIKNQEDIKIWSPSYFKDLIKKLKFE